MGLCEYEFKIMKRDLLWKSLGISEIFDLKAVEIKKAVDLILKLRQDDVLIGSEDYRVIGGLCEIDLVTACHSPYIYEECNKYLRARNENYNFHGSFNKKLNSKNLFETIGIEEYIFQISNNRQVLEDIMESCGQKSVLQFIKVFSKDNKDELLASDYVFEIKKNDYENPMDHINNILLEMSKEDLPVYIPNKKRR